MDNASSMWFVVQVDYSQLIDESTDDLFAFENSAVRVVYNSTAGGSAIGSPFARQPENLEWFLVILQPLRRGNSF